MIFLEKEDMSYTAKCDICGKEYKYCPSQFMAEEVCYDDNWYLIKEGKDVVRCYCSKCKEKVNNNG